VGGESKQATRLPTIYLDVKPRLACPAMRASGCRLLLRRRLFGRNFFRRWLLSSSRLRGPFCGRLLCRSFFSGLPLRRWFLRGRLGRLLDVGRHFFLTSPPKSQTDSAR
jgi:hypothetical protein